MYTLSGMHPSVSVLAALDEALPQTPTTARDLAAVALARRLALDIDEAELIHVEFLAILDDMPGGVHDTLLRRLRKMGARIETTAVLATLSPKLTAVLTELGMTPASRGVLLKGRPDDGPAEQQHPDADDLDRIRRDRAARGARTR